MFHQPQQTTKNDILITSSSIIGKKRSAQQGNVLLQLQQIIKLIEEKYTTDEVEGCFNPAEPNKMKIVFPTGLSSVIDGERQKDYKRPIDYLLCFENTEVRNGPINRWHLRPVSIIAIIEEPQWQNIIKGLERMPTPSEEVVNQIHRSALREK